AERPGMASRVPSPSALWCMSSPRSPLGVGTGGELAEGTSFLAGHGVDRRLFRIPRSRQATMPGGLGSSEPPHAKRGSSLGARLAMCRHGLLPRQAAPRSSLGMGFIAPFRAGVMPLGAEEGGTAAGWPSAAPRESLQRNFPLGMGSIAWIYAEGPEAPRTAARPGSRARSPASVLLGRQREDGGGGERDAAAGVLRQGLHQAHDGGAGRVVGLVVHRQEAAHEAVDELRILQVGDAD